MKKRTWLSVVLAALILVSGSAWAGEGCCKANADKKDSTCQKEDKDKKCCDEKKCDKEKTCDKAKDPNCPKSDKAK